MQAASTISSLNSMHNATPSRSLRDKATNSANLEGKPAEAHRHAHSKDVYIPSGAKIDAAVALAKENLPVDESIEESADSSKIADFNMEEFNQKIRQQLLDQIFESKKIIKESGVDIKWASDILYPVDETEVAAEVPEEWNAENTSQRIVDFALQFRGVAKEQGLTDEEFITQIKEAVTQGFRLAKQDLGSIPSQSAKLFNDTFELSMKKLDDAFAGFSAEESPEPAVAINPKALAYAK